MRVTNETYFSKEANKEYLSVSQYKDFVGTIGKKGCESQALAKLNGEWEIKKTEALMIGSYIDAYLEGTLKLFQEQNPETFTKQGVLRNGFNRAEEVITRMKRDKLFMQFLSGEKQVVMTANLFGTKWKIKLDSYFPERAIVDLKVMRELRRAEYAKDYGYMNFIEYWGYDIQGAVYQEVVYQNTGYRLPFYIAAASKEKFPDLEIIWIDDGKLKEKLIEVEQNLSKVLAVKNGEVEPIRCGSCDYCKHTKVLEKPIHFSEILGEL